MIYAVMKLLSALLVLCAALFVSWRFCGDPADGMLLNVASAQQQKRGTSVLQSSKVMSLVAATDLKRATAFYQGKLGLKLTHEDGHVLVFDTNGAMLRVSRVDSVTAAPYSILGWQVDDIRKAVGELKRNGVAFDRFPGFEQDELAVWTAPDKTRVAWFKDPDGNVLSVVQFP